MLASGKKEVSLYFHIPFCSRKCPYCHFYVVPNNRTAHKELLGSLRIEWESVLEKLTEKKIHSIYFGGGTPTLFGSNAIGEILDWIYNSKIELSDDCEITLEANPEDIVTPSFMAEFKAIGINRVSIGVQTFDDTLLTILKRTHNAKQAEVAIDHTHQAGFENISIDLMYDLPHQSLQQWQHTLQVVKSLPITHLSLYNLIIEPHTAFFKIKQKLLPTLPSEPDSLSMIESACSSLESIDLKRYEISAFAKEGFHSRHNVGYWTARPFLGLGPSAFSYWNQTRTRNYPHLNRYSAALNQGNSPIDFTETLSYPDNLHELLAVQLRLLTGVDLQAFQKKQGLLPDKTLEIIKNLEKKGWIERDSHQIRLSAQGLLFYDSIAEEII